MENNLKIKNGYIENLEYTLDSMALDLNNIIDKYPNDSLLNEVLREMQRLRGSVVRLANLAISKNNNEN